MRVNFNRRHYASWRRDNEVKAKIIRKIVKVILTFEGEIKQNQRRTIFSKQRIRGLCIVLDDENEN